MPKFDLHNHIDVKRGMSPVAAGTDNTAYVSQILDTRDAGSAEFLILTGVNTDANATFATIVEESDASDLSGSNVVAAADLLGTVAQASFTFADDNKVFKIGYIGSKRYVRVTVTPSGNDAGNIFIAGVWVLGKLKLGPSANPPV